MPFAVQAVPFLAGLGVLGAALAWFLGPWGALPSVVLALFVLFFFRDPERRPPAGEGLVLSPADGRVTSVERDAQGARVTIFLSLFDCHINRAPVAGVVASTRHTPGRFRPAYDPRAGSENERNEVIIRAAGSVYGVTQVAGILARRIVCTKTTGDSVARGERIGLIRFGSRTDLRLPQGVDPLVAEGDRVRGGLTIVAREQPQASRAGGDARS